MIEKVWNPDGIRDQIQLRAIQRRRPLSCTMELTYRCNFHCRMCYIRMTDEQAAPYGRLRTVEEWLDMARQMRDAGVLNLTLTGGECTGYPGFERLYEQLARMGFRITVMTNAGAYTESIREIFRKYPPLSVGITLYGGNNETYEAVTGDPRGLDKVVENIRFFQSIRVPVYLTYTIIRQNVMDYPQIAKMCSDFGIPYTITTDITSHRYATSWSDALRCRLSPAERVFVACCRPDEIADIAEEAGKLEKELSKFRIPEIPNVTMPSKQDACIGSYTACAICWNGDMQTCISMNGYQCVKPFEVGFETAWRQLKAVQEETFRRPAVCQTCSMETDCLHNCAGRRFEGTGSPHEPDPYTCQYTWLLKRYKEKQNRTDVAESPKCV